MILDLDQPIAAAPDAVVDALTDAGFYARLAGMPNVGQVDVLEQHREGDVVRQRVRFTFDGHLSPAVRRVLDPDRVTWVDSSTVHRAERRAEFEIVPDHYRGRLECTGSYWIESDSQAASIQHLRFDIRVHYPVVGPLVERALASGIRQNVVHEARIVEEWAADRAHPTDPD